MRPPSDELPELRKQCWSVVWSRLGWVDTVLCQSWRGEEWAECHSCWGKTVCTGECWLSMGHFMAARWRSSSLCFSLPLQPCVLSSSFAIVFCAMGAGKGRGKKDAEQVCLVQGEEVYNLFWGMCRSAGKENGCTELNYVAKEKMLSLWSEYHLLFWIFRLAKRTNSAILYC